MYDIDQFIYACESYKIYDFHVDIPYYAMEGFRDRIKSNGGILKSIAKWFKDIWDRFMRWLGRVKEKFSKKPKEPKEIIQEAEKKVTEEAETQIERVVGEVVDSVKSNANRERDFDELNKTKADVSDSINKRHQDANRYIHHATQIIFNDGIEPEAKKESDKWLDEIADMLDELDMSNEDEAAGDIIDMVEEAPAPESIKEKAVDKIKDIMENKKETQKGIETAYELLDKIVSEERLKNAKMKVESKAATLSRALSAISTNWFAISNAENKMESLKRNLTTAEESYKELDSEMTICRNSTYDLLKAANKQNNMNTEIKKLYLDLVNSINTSPLDSVGKYVKAIQMSLKSTTKLMNEVSACIDDDDMFSLEDDTRVPAKDIVDLAARTQAVFANTINFYTKF